MIQGSTNTKRDIHDQEINLMILVANQRSTIRTTSKETMANIQIIKITVKGQEISTMIVQNHIETVKTTEMIADKIVEMIKAKIKTNNVTTEMKNDQSINR